MKLSVEIQTVSYPTRTTFRISRSSVMAVDVVQISLFTESHLGRGECRPYPRYNQSPKSVTAELESVRPLIEASDIETALAKLESSGAARNALESAWVDLHVKQTAQTAAEFLNVPRPKARQTAFTLSWGPVAQMVAAAKDAKDYPWLKIKIGSGGLDQVLAVADARPDAQLIIDANEALKADALLQFLDALSGLNIALIEQPLPAGHESTLPETNLIICADEGLHSKADMMTLESLCDIIDLDGALLLGEDIEAGLIYDGAIVNPPTKALWG